MTLSEAELAALREQIQSTTAERTRELAPDGKIRDVVRYDLVNARSGGEGRLPTLDIVYERFAGLLAEALTRLAGGPVVVRPQTAVILKFAECNAAIPSPYAVQVVELGGLRGAALLCLDPSLLFFLFDLMLGGTPTKPVDAAGILTQRGLTAVEKRLFAHLIRLIGTEMTSAWDGVAPIALRPIRAETDPKHAAVFEASEPVIHAMFRVETSAGTGEIRFILPQAAIKPIEKKLASGLVDAGAETPDDWSVVMAGVMLDVGVLCTAELGHTSMTVLDLFRLQVGSVIRLDRHPDSEITVFVEGTPKYAGAIEVSSGNFSVSLQRRVDGDNPAKPDQPPESARTEPHKPAHKPESNKHEPSKETRP